MTDEEANELRNRILGGEVRRWDVEYDEGTWNPTKEKLGYFGKYGIVSVGGKKMVVECDPRDSLLRPQFAEWYDDVKWTVGEAWDTDTRFRSNPNAFPVLVRKDGFGWGMIRWYGRKPCTSDWYDAISPEKHWMKTDANGGGLWVYSAAKKGKPAHLVLTPKGTEVCVGADEIKAKMDEVKGWTKDDILHKWIEADQPCSFIYGFAYKGASARPITKEEALEKIKHHEFGMGYYSMDWVVFDGKVTLQFEEYSEGDML